LIDEAKIDAGSRRVLSGVAFGINMEGVETVNGGQFVQRLLGRKVSRDGTVGVATVKRNADAAEEFTLVGDQAVEPETGVHDGTAARRKNKTAGEKNNNRGE